MATSEINHSQIRTSEVTDTTLTSESLGESDLDMRALRTERRNIQSDAEAFLSALKAGEFNGNTEAAEVAYQNYLGKISKLKLVIEASASTLSGLAR